VLKKEVCVLSVRFFLLQGAGGADKANRGHRRGTDFGVLLSLCLSRACLGKMIVFIYKRLKKDIDEARKRFLFLPNQFSHVKM
jgi:hypothetical protein